MPQKSPWRLLRFAPRIAQAKNNPASSRSAGYTIVKLPSQLEIGPLLQRPDGTVVAFGGVPHSAIYHTDTGTWAAGPDFPNKTIQ